MSVIGSVVGFLAGLWVFVAVFYAFYCWATKTDRKDPPVARRIQAFVLGLAWPLDLYKVLSSSTHDKNGDRTT